jgi:hypothetical protein
MMALLCFFLTLFASLFKSKSRLEAENAALRHQLIVLQRRVSGRVQPRKIADPRSAYAETKQNERQDAAG